MGGVSWGYTARLAVAVRRASTSFSAAITSLEALAKLPVLRKSDLSTAQKKSPQSGVNTCRLVNVSLASIRMLAAPARTVAVAPVKTDKAEASAKPARRSNKLSYNETRELERLPDDIAELEAEQAALQEALLNPDIYKTDPKQAHEWQLRVNEIDTLLLDKLARWDELESRAS